MKLLQAIFAVQLCAVLTASQAWALAGGPVYDSATSYTGDYSGALIAAEEVGQGEAVAQGDDVIFEDSVPTDAIGLFSVGVPIVGLASGPVYIFASGRAYTGSMQAFVDPDGGNITGQISTRFDYFLPDVEFDENGNPRTVSVPVTATAVGKLEGSIAQDVSTYSGSLNSIRINGKAKLEVGGGFIRGDGSVVVESVIKFQVIGYKQSDTQSIAAALEVIALDPAEG